MATRKYIAIADWDQLQYHKKLDNPPWTRLHQSWLNDYRFSQLSLQQWGVLFGMHMLAARTGNRIPHDLPWIAKQLSKRTSPVSKVILNLISTGFLLEFEANPNSKENTYLGFIPDAAIASPEGEGRRRTDTDIPSIQHCARTESKPPDSVAASSLDNNFEKALSPAPTARRNNRAMQSISDALNGHSKNGRDPRTFDELKQAILPVALRLNCTDPDELHRLAGQSLRISPKQCATAVHQLIEDGKL